MHYSKSLIHTCPSDRKTVIWLNLRSNPDILLRSSKGVVILEQKSTS